MSNIQNTREVFNETFGHAPQYTIRAPGRVNLIGEHTDYNGGLVLPCAIQFVTEVSIAAREDAQIIVVACDFDNARDEFSATARPAQSATQWANYVRGVVDVFQQKFGAFPNGCEMVISGDVPQGAGLSSSASLEVAVGKALQTLYGFSVTGQEIALLGQQAENDFVGCHCGNMDQLISALGEKNAALKIDCATLATTPVPLPTDLQLVIINSNIQRGLVDSEYNTRRAQCEAAAQHFGVSWLAEVTPQQLQAAEAELDPVTFRRARHVISENQRVLGLETALRENNVPQISQLMAESHASMRDDFQITVPAIDALVALVANVIGERGGVRMTGGGFGGCVVALLPKEMLNDVLFAIAQQYPHHNNGQQASVYICQAEAGAHVC